MFLILRQSYRVRNRFVSQWTSRSGRHIELHHAYTCHIHPQNPTKAIKQEAPYSEIRFNFTLVVIVTDVRAMNKSHKINLFITESNKERTKMFIFVPRE